MVVGVMRGAAGASLWLTAALAALTAPAVAVATPEGATDRFPLPNAESAPTAIAPGPDGDMWFTEYKGEKVASIALDGTLREIPLPTIAARPEGIAPGPDGTVWFAERKGDSIGRIGPNGLPSEFPLPSPNGEPEAIALGPDGNMWFTEYAADKVGRITPTGAITEFPLPTPESGPLGITAGPDGNLWFVEYRKNQVGRITPEGSVTELAIPTPESGPWAIAAGPDGDLWFAEFKADQIGRVTPSGAFSEFPLPTPLGTPASIAPGPDGNVWFGEYKAGKVGRITPDGAIAEFLLPAAESRPSGIAPGPDGDMWVTESGANAIAQVGTGAPPASLSSPVVQGGGVAGVAQTCKASWSTWGTLQPSSSLFAFDGYKWLLEGQEVSSGPSYTPARDQAGQPLSCQETVTYPLLDVTSTLTSPPVAIAALPPAIGRLHESVRVWREGHALARSARAGHARRRPPVGTTISFTLSEDATVSFAFARRVGHRHRACKGTGPSRAKGTGCAGTRLAGRLSLKGRKGLNKIVFQGRISRGQALGPGGYELLLTAINGEGERSATRSLSFRIVR